MYTIKEWQRGGEMTIDQVDRGWGPALAWARGAGAAVGAEVPVIWFLRSVDVIICADQIR